MADGRRKTYEDAAGAVRTGGKGSIRRKKKAVYKTLDKSLQQSTLKRTGIPTTVLNTKGTKSSSLGSAAQRKSEPTVDDEDNNDDDWAFHNHDLCIESYLMATIKYPTCWNTISGCN
ncbi:hypothetical protein R6Q59_028537 [Mikania micrantha]